MLMCMCSIYTTVSTSRLLFTFSFRREAAEQERRDYELAVRLAQVCPIVVRVRLAVKLSV